MERNNINVIMELSYRMDASNSFLSRKDIRKDYFPGIFKVTPMIGIVVVNRQKF